MNRRTVVSHSIASIGYDTGSRILEIEFCGGSVYQYHSVPGVEYLEFITSASCGRHFADRIRDRYGYTRLG